MEEGNRSVRCGWKGDREKKAVDTGNGIQTGQLEWGKRDTEVRDGNEGRGYRVDDCT